MKIDFSANNRGGKKCLLPRDLLHGTQASRKFSREFEPPLLLGFKCSRVSFSAGKQHPHQQQHEPYSLRS